ncbi:hypothetical protein HOF65_01290 [bacterium]|nr:hypothetical protein [bacterium]
MLKFKKQRLPKLDKIFLFIPKSQFINANFDCDIKLNTFIVFSKSCFDFTSILSLCSFSLAIDFNNSFFLILNSSSKINSFNNKSVNLFNCFYTKKINKNTLFKN